MSQSLSKILLHTVFSTKERRPFLREPPLRGQLHEYLGGILKHLGCQPVIVGGVADHVHLLTALSRTLEAAEMVKELKRSSSLWIKEHSPGLWDFAWQNGYGVFSIIPSGWCPVQDALSAKQAVKTRARMGPANPPKR